MLVSKGVSLKNTEEYYPVYYAIDNREVDIAMYLIEQCADLSSVDNETLLHIAVEKSYYEIVVKLIEKGMKK